MLCLPRALSRGLLFFATAAPSSKIAEPFLWYVAHDGFGMLHRSESLAGVGFGCMQYGRARVM